MKCIDYNNYCDGLRTGSGNAETMTKTLSTDEFTFRYNAINMILYIYIIHTYIYIRVRGALHCYGL